MLKRVISVILCAVMLLSVMPLSAMTAEAADSVPTTPFITYNKNIHDTKGYYATPITSYLYDNGSGYTRMEYDYGTIYIENYDRSYNFLSAKTITPELPLWGGFYAGTDYNFIFVGQENPEEDNNKEVIRIIRYTKNWQRVDSASLRGANTTVPFDAGSLRAVQYGDMLYVRTSHEMYTSSDGLNHQANLTFSVKVSSMTITDSQYSVSNSGYGYCSHSFNQFIKTDGKKIVAVDHGDAYPRAIAIFCYSSEAGNNTFVSRCEKTEVMDIYGSIGANYTGVYLGGFEVSSTGYLVAGRAIKQTSSGITLDAQNIFVTYTTRNSLGMGSTTKNWLTNYTEADDSDLIAPHLVKISDTRFLLMWSAEDKLFYTFINNLGQRTTDVYSSSAMMSDCQPIVCGNKVVWYAGNGIVTRFYEIDLNSPSTVKTAKTYSIADGCPTLTLDVERVDTFRSREEKWYKFTAPSSGTFTFASLGTDGDPHGYLYKSVDDAAVATNDDGYNYSSGNPWNFTIKYTLAKGETVYLKVYSRHSRDVNYGILVTQGNVTSTTSRTTTTTTTTKPTTTTTTVPNLGIRNVIRLAGNDRIGTAIAVSEELFGRADNVIIASGDDYADALAGVPLAYALDAPILLVRGGRITDETIAELRRLGASTVYILGGEVAVSAKIENSLESSGYTVHRIAGTNRFGTAVEIAKRLQSIEGAPDEVFFAYSHNYPDALAVSGIAATMGCPVLYIAANGRLDAETISFIRSSGADIGTILGGTAVISADAEDSIENAGIETVSRIGGTNRYETCLNVNRAYADIFSGETVCVATGNNYPDALAGGVLAAMYGAPLVLVGDSLGSNQAEYIDGVDPDVCYIFGGTGAVSKQIENKLK